MDNELSAGVSSDNGVNITKAVDNAQENPYKSEPEKKANLGHFFVSAFLWFAQLVDAEHNV